MQHTLVHHLSLPTWYSTHRFFYGGALCQLTCAANLRASEVSTNARVYYSL